MNISLPHDVFLKALEKGGIAIFGSDGLLDEGLRETIPTQRCVKLTAKEGTLSIEASVNKANSIYVCKHEGIKFIEDGSLCVDAVELRSNLKSLKYSHTVYFEFDKETLNPKAGKGSDTITPLGKVMFKAVNEVGREAFKLDLTAYSTNDFVQTSYSDGTDAKLKIQSKVFCESVNFVAFASGEDQMTGLFDHVCVFSKGGDVHIAATDNKRAALTTLEKSSYEGDNEGDPIFIESKMALSIMSQMPNDSTHISIILDPDDEHVTFKVEDFKIRTSLPPSVSRSKFPTFASAINMPVGASIVFDPKREVEQTVSRLLTSYHIGVFSADAGDEEVGIKCWNMNVSGKAGCRKIENGLKNPINLPLQFILEIIKRLPADAVKFSFSEDEKKVIVQSVDRPTPFYLMQRVTPTDV